MSTTHTSHSLLLTTFIGIALLVTLIFSKGALADQEEITTDLITWSKISDQKVSYNDAVKFCQDKATTLGPDGVMWDLPTEEQMKNFYKKTVMPVLKSTGSFYGWPLDNAWLSTETSNNSHDTVNLANGIVDWNGEANNQKAFVTCVKTKGNIWYDSNSNLTWSKVITTPMNYAAAAEYCNRLGRGDDQNHPWKVPSAKQLEAFGKNYAQNNPDALKKWMLGNAWGQMYMDGTYMNFPVINLTTGKQEDLYGGSGPGADISKSSTLKYLVTCVR